MMEKSKKQIKREAKRAQNAELRKAKRMEERQRKKEKRKLLKSQGLLPIKEKCIQTPSNLNIVIDTSFEEKMNEKERISLSNQIIRNVLIKSLGCYSVNRKHPTPCKLSVTSFQPIDTELWSHTHNIENIEKKYISFHTDSYTKLFEKDQLIYLSGDAEETLEHIDENKVYIIGGIVDKNREKGLCLAKAKQEGIQCCKLPIGNYIEKMKGRKILAVNHVFEILIDYFHKQNWKDVFQSNIPQRYLGDEVSVGPDQIVEPDQPDQIIEPTQIVEPHQIIESAPIIEKVQLENQPCEPFPCEPVSKNE